MDREPVGAEGPLSEAERQFLIDSGTPANSFDPERQAAARASLRRRADETRREASPELTTEQVAGLLGITAPQVLGLANRHELYAFATDDGLRFPEWQFPDGQRLPGLAQVLRELDVGMQPYSVEGLLADVPHEELDDKTVVEWLAAGGSLEPAISLAASSRYEM